MPPKVFGQLLHDKGYPSGPIHRVRFLPDFVPEGKGTLCQGGSPKVMGVYQAYFRAYSKNARLKNSPMKKSRPVLTEKLNVSGTFEVLAR